MDITFDSSNWWKPQDIKITAIDDLLIEGNVAANIEHTFTSDDARFNGLSETLSVNVIDNDFQRSIENNKIPSDGNNYIKFDFLGTDADNSPTNANNRYDLKSGNDKLEITGSFQEKLDSKTIFGSAGNDEIIGGTFIDGGDGDDILSTFETGTWDEISIDTNSHQYTKNSKNIQGRVDTAKIAGGAGNDTITGGKVSIAATGGSGNDKITGSTSGDWIWGDGYEGLRFTTNYDRTYNASWNGSLNQDRSASAFGEVLPVIGVTNTLLGGNISVDTEMIKSNLNASELQEYYGQYLFNNHEAANGSNAGNDTIDAGDGNCLLYTSPSPRD